MISHGNIPGIQLALVLMGPYLRVHMICSNFTFNVIFTTGIAIFILNVVLEQLLVVLVFPQIALVRHGRYTTW